MTLSELWLIGEVEQMETEVNNDGAGTSSKVTKTKKAINNKENKLNSKNESTAVCPILKIKQKMKRRLL